MMKMVFLLLCGFSLMADETESLSYKTIDINGFQTEQEPVAAGETADQAKEEVSQVPEELPEAEELIPAPLAEVEIAPAPKPRLSRLDKKKILRNKIQHFNNELLKEGIENQRLHIESELGNKVKKLDLNL